MQREPQLYIIAGPNGAGKTTFAEEFLPNFADCLEFVNADMIAKGLSPFAPERAAWRAGRLMLEHIAELLQRRVDFAFETTLSGRNYVKTLREARSLGYSTHLFFLWVPSVDLSIARVADRVQRGGHDIPEDVVRRRFNKGIHNLFHYYRPLLTSWMLFDNSSSERHLIATEDHGKLIVVDCRRYEAITREAGVR